MGVYRVGVYGGYTKSGIKRRKTASKAASTWEKTENTSLSHAGVRTARLFSPDTDINTYVNTVPTPPCIAVTERIRHPVDLMPPR